MKPTKIAFTKKYFPEQYHGEDYYIEYILEEGDTLQDAFKKAKEETLQCFKNNNPQIQWYPEVIQVNGNHIPGNDKMVVEPKIAEALIASNFYEKPPPEKIQKGTIEEQIEACTTLDELTQWRLLADSTKKLKLVYDKTLEKIAEKQSQKLQTT